MDFHAIVPAGGFGRRLWPWSTAARPKFLLSLDNNRSLAQLTAQRLAPLAASLTFVTGRDHREALQAQIADLGLDLPYSCVAEPSPRNSMAAIALGVAWVEKRYGTCLVGSFAADHVIADEAAFREAVTTACVGASDGRIVTIGITPTAPATGFGYIEVGAELPGRAPGLCQVKSFKEKPNADLAQTWFHDGGFLWNAGMFVMRTDVLLDALEQRVPNAGVAARKLADGWETLSQDAKAALWEGIVNAPIDTVLIEPLAAAGRVAVVPAVSHLGWSDVGDWNVVAGIMQRASSDNSSQVPPVYLEDSPAALVRSENLKGVAVIGIPEAVVVESGGKLLVTTRKFAQKVKNASESADKW